jgi:hypothetical protein
MYKDKFAYKKGQKCPFLDDTLKYCNREMLHRDECDCNCRCLELTPDEFSKMDLLFMHEVIDM